MEEFIEKILGINNDNSFIIEVNRKEEKCKLVGNEHNLLIGVAMIVKALLSSNVSKDNIKEAVKIGMQVYDEEKNEVKKNGRTKLFR